MSYVKMDSHTPSANRTQRLFFALWPDNDLRQQLVNHAAQWIWPNGCVRYLPEDWHLTLQFIGQVHADRAVDIVALAAVPFQPFTLTLDQPMCWPHGLAVLCMSQAPAPLQALYERLGDALRRLDLPVETRPYQPHVTLARRATAAILPAGITPVVWQARRYMLVESTGIYAPRYRVIHQYEQLDATIKTP
jgi:2'-5' RNA ligase